MFWPDSTHQHTHPPTHPSNHTPTHGWRILYRFQIFKWNWYILISSSVIKFLLIPGVDPLGGGRWVDGVRVGMGVWEVSHAHAHTCTHTHMHTHACTCMLNMLNMDASMSVAICNFYTCIHVRVCMCMHVHACGDTPMSPDAPRHPPTCPFPQSCREPITPKFNKSWTNQDNLILFEDSLPLNIPELI